MSCCELKGCVGVWVGRWVGEWVGVWVEDKPLGLGAFALMILCSSSAIEKRWLERWKAAIVK